MASSLDEIYLAEIALQCKPIILLEQLEAMVDGSSVVPKRD